jgi:hypothetical protein
MRNIRRIAINTRRRNNFLVNKSAKCIEQQHEQCDGNIIELINDSSVTRICECQCHDYMYKLVSRMQAANN